MAYISLLSDFAVVISSVAGFILWDYKGELLVYVSHIYEVLTQGSLFLSTQVTNQRKVLLSTHTIIIQILNTIFQLERLRLLFSLQN